MPDHSVPTPAPSASKSGICPSFVFPLPGHSRAAACRLGNSSVRSDLIAPEPCIGSRGGGALASPARRLGLVEPAAPGTRTPLRAESSTGRLRVGLVSDQPEPTRTVREQLRSLPGIEVCDAAVQHLDVLFCVAGSACSLVEILSSLSWNDVPRILLDRVAAIGPRVAALHGVYGYLAPASQPLDLLATSVRRAARRRPYAPEPFADEFQYTWARGPLTHEERALLQLANSGLTRHARATRLGWSDSTLYRREQELRDRLDLDEHDSLEAVAVELGFHRFWPPASYGP
jgi:DNA-binding NarL/FixJ family response regulator